MNKNEKQKREYEKPIIEIENIKVDNIFMNLSTEPLIDVGDF